MRVLVNTRRPDPVTLAEVQAEAVGLDEAFARADVVSLHLPLTEQTRGVVTGAVLDLLAPGSILVNTAAVSCSRRVRWPRGWPGATCGPRSTCSTRSRCLPTTRCWPLRGRCSARTSGSVRQGPSTGWRRERWRPRGLRGRSADQPGDLVWPGEPRARDARQGQGGRVGVGGPADPDPDRRGDRLQGRARPVNGDRRSPRHWWGLATRSGCDSPGGGAWRAPAHRRGAPGDGQAGLGRAGRRGAGGSHPAATAEAEQQRRRWRCGRSRRRAHRPSVNATRSTGCGAADAPWAFPRRARPDGPSPERLVNTTATIPRSFLTTGGARPGGGTDDPESRPSEAPRREHRR